MFRNFYLLIDFKELRLLSAPGEALICFDHQRHQWAVLHHQHQHQTEFLSALPWTHIPYLCTWRSPSSFKSYWQATLNGISWISFSIVFRFRSNLGKLAVEAFWDNVDRSMTNRIHQINPSMQYAWPPQKVDISCRTQKRRQAKSWRKDNLWSVRTGGLLLLSSNPS